MNPRSLHAPAVGPPSVSMSVGRRERAAGQPLRSRGGPDQILHDRHAIAILGFVNNTRGNNLGKEEGQ